MGAGRKMVRSNQAYPLLPAPTRVPAKLPPVASKPVILHTTKARKR